MKHLSEFECSQIITKLKRLPSQVFNRGSATKLVIKLAVALLLCSLPYLGCASRPRGAPVPTALVGWWPGEGNANDRIGAHNGALLGEVAFVPGKVGQAFSLEGFNSYVNVPSSPALKPTGPFTVEAWVNYKGFTGPDGGTIVAKGEDVDDAIDWALVIGPAQKLRPHLNVAGDWVVFNCDSRLAPGVWYHVAMIYDGSSLSGYVNGLLDGTIAASGAVQATDYPLRIGAYAPVTGTHAKAYFAGQVDEVSLYNRALSANEIQAIYQAGSAGRDRRAHP